MIAPDNISTDFLDASLGYLSADQDGLKHRHQKLAAIAKRRTLSQREAAILQAIAWGISNSVAWKHLQRPFKFKRKPIEWITPETNKEFV